MLEDEHSLTIARMNRTVTQYQKLDDISIPHRRLVKSLPNFHHYMELDEEDWIRDIYFNL